MTPINVIPFSGNTEERERYLHETGFYSAEFPESGKVMSEFVSDMLQDPGAVLLFYDCLDLKTVNDAATKYQELVKSYPKIPIVLIGTSEETFMHYPRLYMSVTERAKRLFEQIQTTNPSAHYQVSLSSEYGHAVDMLNPATREEILASGPSLSAPLTELRSLIADHYTSQ